MVLDTVEQSAPGRARRERMRAVAWALLGVVLLAFSVAMSLLVPGRIAEEQAFLDARPCAGAQSARGTAADCLHTIRGTVRSAEVAKSGKADVFRVRLLAPVPAPADRPMDLDSDGELSRLIEPGDQVEVTTWRDVRVSVSHDGVSETLPGLPDEATMFAGLTLIGVWATMLAFIAVFGSARRARCLAAGRPVVPRVPFGMAKGLAVVVVPLTVAYFALSVWDAWTAVGMTVCIWALIALPATVAALRWDRDGSPASAPSLRT
ncbi:hypothetical protein [Streptomyces sp. NBC_01408]|uniref:hypothetical protein n=1 Tax=Streptomyces sp. NBC_01408 TaxID=2903855 RepID=UPI0022593F43|nr:hypothetical protein [Streptomyces sp. NBC_01408]MCX4695390.1 hypothetical protein [Streptomyces sp. NBC_01408]